VGLEVITEYKNIIYKTSNEAVGSTAHLLAKSGPFGRSCHFSNHLAASGNFVNNGLNTQVEKERFLEASKDWMLKN